MRTRIALATIAPIAVITITILIQAATVQSARAVASPPSGAASTTVTHLPAPHHRVDHQPGTTGPGLFRSNLLSDLNTALLARAAANKAAAHAGPTAAPHAAPAAAPPPPATPAPALGPIDTVSSADRAAWERVAMCEEGGNWSARSSRFSGGLGITRSNWDNYGGQQFAPEGAMATEDQQIMVAERIQPSPPDGYGCSGW
ncbi:MAG TPA: transglycosylase family protein [Acidimicrobiales bacterium]|jgi:hypothetical protein|nr:transglycosylase family protein [Acidimicrobiales bacterium]